MATLNKENILLLNKVKYILFSIGMNEKHVAFDHLATLITLLLLNSESKETFKLSLQYICKCYNVVERTIKQGINKIFKTCKEPKITSSFQFQIQNNSTYNRVKIITYYIKNVLKETSYI